MHPLIQTHIGCHINHVLQMEQCEMLSGGRSVDIMSVDSGRGISIHLYNPIET